MKLLNRTNSLDRLLLASVCATSIAMSACSEMAAKHEKPSEAQTCEDLKGLIADHPNQFSHYRKNLSTHRRLNIWSAKKVFPNADNCQVWECVGLLARNAEVLGHVVAGLRHRVVAVLLIIARFGNGARGYITMFANGKQVTMKTRP